MKIGSHDSMSYATPEKWYYKPFHFVAKCQSKTIQEQYDLGIRLFDLRVRWDKDCWKFSHGRIIFKTEPVEDILKFLNSKKDCLVRLVLEYNSPTKDIDEISERFVEYCEKWIDVYNHTKFYEFTRKYDWKKLYSYEGEPEPVVYQAVSSMTSLISARFSWLDDWFPYWYASLQNHDNIIQGCDAEYMLLDFVDIQ